MLVHQINSTECGLAYGALDIFQFFSEVTVKTISSKTDIKVSWAHESFRVAGLMRKMIKT